MTARRCFLGAPCADCGVGTFTINEYYLVRDDVWEQAWAGRCKPWHQIDGQSCLCIGCLEKRIGRTLTKHDFDNVPINDPRIDPNKSARLLDRLTTETGTVKGIDGLVAWAIEGMISRLPEDKREAARQSARDVLLKPVRP